MDVILTIIAVIVIFSALVLIHEWGHFAAARRAGIKVTEFGIGFPPRIFGKKIGDTLYSINAIPFGGFVRLFGEDATSPAILKNKRSFAHKSPWTRTKVVVAGVVMNFVLAIVLLTIGFSFGIEPLLVTEDDLFTHLSAGNVQTVPGIIVARVNEDVKNYGLKPGDRIIAIDDQPIVDMSQLAIFRKSGAKKDIDITVAGSPASNEPELIRGATVQRIHVPLMGGKNYFGIDLKPITELPYLAISEVKLNSRSKRAGLQTGDIILRVNGENVYFMSDFDVLLTQSSGNVSFEVLRGSETLNIPVDLPDTNRVVISNVFADSAASTAGFKRGDIIISINDVAVTGPQQVQSILSGNIGVEMDYDIYRDGKKILIRAATGESKMLGVALSSITSYKNSEISLYKTGVLTSITEIKKVRYGPWVAFKQATSESIRLTGLTIQVFVKTIGSALTKFSVPDEVGGPVQIAVYTHTFVKEGFFALLRFAALLSLSLAVINILPIPALDGGRLLFIVIEVIAKKRVNARVESAVHAIGFVLLLILIGLVTYSDIAKLF